ncbi:ABC transporter ATP-binding protein [Rhodobacteraceae bacterium NNCM2]|nr:ABC transporter ATP-binding protein [Coraliihabitans acroporae]
MIQLYKAIWQHTARQQIILLVLSLIVAGLAAVPLEYQKNIINGLSDGLTHDQLLVLGLQMIGIILVSLGIKWALGYQSGIVGEWVIMRLRKAVYRDAIGTEPANGAPAQKGTISTLISSEAETIGKFVGNAVAEPVLQWGTMISVVGYIAASQPRLGLIVVAIVVPQAIIVLTTQAKINALVRDRVLLLRKSINEITASDLRELKQSVLDDFDTIYDARRRIFIWKLSTKFVLSALNGVGLVTVLIIGGSLVIDGKSDVGIVVAATIGLNRIQQPWRLLITFYRNLSAVQVQFDLMNKMLEQLRETQHQADAER